MTQLTRLNVLQHRQMKIFAPAVNIKHEFNFMWVVKMNAKYWNNTISLNHINLVMPLISLMSTHFYINSFTLMSDVETLSPKTFVKIASKFYLTINCNVEENSVDGQENNGYIIIGKPDFRFSKVINRTPKLVAAIFALERKDTELSKVFSKLVIPPSTSFFIIPITRNAKYFSSRTVVKCIRLYRPITNLPLKVFPTMLYGGPGKPEWTWASKKINWNSFERETRDMNGVTITIALVSQTEKEKALKKFWAGRNSFFWKAMADHLRFRPLVYYEKAAEDEKSMAKVYLRLMMTVADGLGVLPVVSPERSLLLDFILTGIDSKYHLIVKAPEYVHSWQSILKPLALESWIALIIAILLISITLRITTHHEDSLTTDFSSCCLTVFGFVCSQGCPRMPRNLSAYIVCYTALLFSILMYQFYTSNFYSLLSTKEVSLPFTSLEEFIVKGTHTLYVHPDSEIYSYIVKAEDGTFKKLWDEYLKKDPMHQLKSNTKAKIFSIVCKGTGVIFSLPFRTMKGDSIPCKLVSVSSGYFPTNLATGVRKEFPFTSQFRFVHMRLLEAGIVHHFRDQHISYEKQKVKADVINEPVSLIHVAFPFALYAASVILSCLILILEIITSKTVKSLKIGKKIK